MSSKKITEHLAELVGIGPVSSDQPKVLAALNYCQNILRKSTSFKDLEIHNFNGVYSLTASTQNTKTPKVLLQAHIDVVPFPPSLTYSENDGQIYGRGVFDMLFATACYLAFIEEYDNMLTYLDIGLMLTGDEELGGVNGVNALLINGYGAEVCILPDAGFGFGDLNISAKGVYQLDLIAQGKAHHGSRPWEGDGAANKLADMLCELMKHFDHTNKDNSTITIARLNAGDADNKGPASAQARLDIRYKDKTDLQRIQKAVDEICEQYGGYIDNIHIGDDYQLDTSNRYVQRFIELYELKLGHEVQYIKSPGSSDARYFDAHSIPVIELRPDGGGAHSDEEFVSMASLERFYSLISSYLLQEAKISAAI